MVRIDHIWITLGSFEWYHYFLNVMHFLFKQDVRAEHYTDGQLVKERNAV